MLIDFDLSRPIYQQIIDEIKRAVARGDLKPGDKLPSHRELAQESKVNPNTVQHAYREMEQEGLVEMLRGQGTFIKDSPGLVERIRDEMASEAILRFLREMESLGYSVEQIATYVLRTLEGQTPQTPPSASASVYPGASGSSEPESSLLTHQNADSGAKADEVI
ncbi:MAG: GntR family transcriptional regulator [Bacteroidota bacterium]